jgi:putative FmdB family regulatory protein
VPTYQYACTACGHRLEKVQSFSDAPLTECPVCEGRLRKVFNTVGVVFKGSGFYRTDSRTGAAKDPDGAKTGDGAKTDSAAAAADKGTKSTSTESSSSSSSTPASSSSGSSSSPAPTTAGASSTAA